MGWFGGNKKEEKIDKELENARKYVETLECKTKEELDKEIAKRIENGRIIQKIDYEIMVIPEFKVAYSALILYDAWAEKARADKDKGLGLGR